MLRNGENENTTTLFSKQPIITGPKGLLTNPCISFWFYLYYDEWTPLPVYLIPISVCILLVKAYQHSLIVACMGPFHASTLECKNAAFDDNQWEASKCI